MATERCSSASTDVVQAVVETVANKESTDPENLPPLYYSIDPDALQDLVSRKDDQFEKITFRYYGHVIAVDSDGTASIIIDEAYL